MQGLDVDPSDSKDSSAATGPYINYAKPGAGIKWVNISCTGTSDDNIGSPFGTTRGNYREIYGSAYFDVGKTCSDGFNGVSMVKYIRIIDDNQETAYFKDLNDGVYRQTMPLGEASTATAGADISEVKVMNFVQLVAPSKYPE